MTYVVVENCIKCKYMDCVEVCPVDCFYEGENMLVIHPDECIDCGVCEPECPAEAIKPDTEAGLEKWLELNAEYSKTWANITVKKEAARRTPKTGTACRKSSKSSFRCNPEPGIEFRSGYQPRLQRVITLLRCVNRFSQICPIGEGKSPFYVAITL